jgi:hypothetical protein
MEKTRTHQSIKLLKAVVFSTIYQSYLPFNGLYALIFQVYLFLKCELKM